MLFETINSKIKTAMLEKDILTKDCLKLIKAKAQAIAKEQKSEIVTDDIVIKALKKELKELEQTENVLGENCMTNSQGYLDVCDKIALVKSLLPKEMSDLELKNKIIEILKENNMTDAIFGLKMKTVMSNIQNVDGKRVSNIIKSL